MQMIIGNWSLYCVSSKTFQVNEISGALEYDGGINQAARWFRLFAKSPEFRCHTVSVANVNEVK